MKRVKFSATSAHLREAVGSAATRLTSPLVLKIILTFGVMAALLVALTTFNLLNLNQGKEASSKALELQNIALSTQHLREAIVRERLSVLNTLSTGLTDPDFKNFQTDFDNEIAVLKKRGIWVAPIIEAHTQVNQTYSKVIETVAAGRPTEARMMLQVASEQSQNLTDLIDNQLNRANSAAMTATDRADRVQDDTTSALLWVAVTAFIVMALALLFVLTRIVRPMRLLNQDLTQLLWTQTEHLTERLNLLQAEINQNDENLTTVRHDLKTPLSNIKGLAELSTILEPDLSFDVRDNLQKIIETADGSVTTISNVLTRRQSNLELQPVRVTMLVDKVLRLVDLRYCTVQRKVEVAEWVLDAGLMEHALLNLVSNARKFSASGIGVGVRKAIKPGTVDTPELELWVWNDGAIITSEDRAEIFKPGKQTEDGKKAGGHGLGLSIVKSIAERHHGRVIVDSHEKIGTTFRIFIPNLAVSPAPETTNTEPELSFQSSALR